jgi:branched-chain amino acid transport system substrate-binding protein
MKKLINNFVAAALLVGGLNVHADIIVGAPFAMSGPVSEFAKGMRQAAEIAVNQVNQQGGVLGKTYKLEFVDTACDPDKATDVVRNLIENMGAVALVGSVCSGETLRQARSVSIPAGVVTLSVASASSLITALDDKDLVFRTAPSDALKGQAMAKTAFNMGIRDIAVSHASDAYNTGVAEIFSIAFKALGGRVTVSQVHQPGRTDYRGEARAAAAGSANLALFAYYGSGGGQYLKDVLSDQSVRRVIGTDGLRSEELTTALSEEQLVRITMVLAAVDKDREAYKRWLTFASANKLKADGPYFANSYDATFMMALAIEKAGAVDRSKVSAALRAIAGPDGKLVYPGEFSKAKAFIKQGVKINYDGASGPVDFDAAGDVAGRFSVNWFANGAWQTTLLK